LDLRPAAVHDDVHLPLHRFDDPVARGFEVVQRLVPHLEGADAEDDVAGHQAEVLQQGAGRIDGEDEDSGERPVSLDGVELPRAMRSRGYPRLSIGLRTFASLCLPEPDLSTFSAFFGSATLNTPVVRPPGAPLVQ